MLWNLRGHKTKWTYQSEYIQKQINKIKTRLKIDDLGEYSRLLTK